MTKWNYPDKVWDSLLMQWIEYYALEYYIILT